MKTLVGKKKIKYTQNTVRKWSKRQGNSNQQRRENRQDSTADTHTHQHSKGKETHVNNQDRADQQRK